MRKINIRRCAVLPLAALLAQAAWGNCRAAVDDIHFGNIDVLSARQAVIPVNISITCSRTSGAPAYSAPQSFNVCLAVDGGLAVARKSAMNPRYLCPNGTCTSTEADQLAFNLYTDPSFGMIWGSSRYQGNASTIDRVVTLNPGEGSRTENITAYAALVSPLSNVAPGTYSNPFLRGSTALSFFTTQEASPRECPSQGSRRFEFTVTANVEKNCVVDKPDNIDFGIVKSSDAGLEGQTALSVACTRNVPYSIGLTPSNNNGTGEGVMSPQEAGNSNKVPYRLRTGSGSGGRAWGQASAAQQAGNGVGSVGTGAVQQHTVYANVPSADYRAGSYRDTVTVQVNY